MPVFLLPILSWFGKLGANVWLYAGLAAGSVAAVLTGYKAVEHEGGAKARAQDAVRDAKANDKAVGVEQHMADAASDRPANATALEGKLDGGEF